MLELYVILQGAASLSCPPERVRAVIDRTEDLALFRFDFAELLAPLLARLVEPYR